MKYILLSLLFSVQAFAYDKTITIYGYVSEQIIHSTLEKENKHYILSAYYMDGEFIETIPFQLLFDNNKTDIISPLDLETGYLRFKRYKLQGIILQKNKKDITEQMFKVGSTEKIFKVKSMEKINGKIKAYSYLNNYGRVKLMITSPMTDGTKDISRYSYEKTPIDYISNIKIQANNKLLYHVNLSSDIAENPLLKFSYKNIKPLIITLEYTDSNGTVKTYNKKVKHSERIIEIPKTLKLLANPKSYPTQIKSIKKLFGNITLIEDGIKLIAPKLAENGASVPISIRSDIKFKSIALFVGGSNYYRSYNSISIKTNNDGFKLVSQWFGTPYSVGKFSARIKIQEGTSDIVVVLEAEDGKFYTVKQKVDFSVGGMGGWLKLFFSKLKIY